MKNRTKLLVLLLASSMLLTACSTTTKEDKKKKKPDRDSHKQEEEETRVSRREVDPNSGNEPDRDLKNYKVGKYLDDGEESWFDEQKLVFTATGNFQMNMYSYGEFVKVPANIDIVTDYDNCEKGYKNIIATTKIDISMMSVNFWTSSFDKYTGTSFEFRNGSNSLYNGCDIINEGDVELNIKKYHYTLHIKEHIQQEDDITTITYTITCPIEYDGTVLQYGAYGYAEDQMDKEFGGGNNWLASDFTEMHGAYNYFTLQGLPTEAK